MILYYFSGFNHRFRPLRRAQKSLPARVPEGPQKIKQNKCKSGSRPIGSHRPSRRQRFVMYNIPSVPGPQCDEMVQLARVS